MDARFTFNNFVVDKPNEFAFAAAQRVGENDTALFNPFYIAK
ncbi:DnaA ATPase domain-containing protein [Candidatus Endolissoclinum faulkneri]